MRAARIALLLLLAGLLLGASGYKRSLYGGWVDEDGDCQDTRAEMLIAASQIPVVMNAENCIVVAGQWVGAYSGETYFMAKDVDIDHLFPLEASWRAGGWAWDKDQRRAFALWPENLVIASASVNRRKGSRGPGEWLPSAMDRCEYVRRWVDVAQKWGLMLTVREAELWAECR